MRTKSTFPPHLAELQILAIETLGSKSKADNWLNMFHPILGNTPIATVESASGLIEVKKILSAIITAGCLVSLNKLTIK